MSTSTEEIEITVKIPGKYKKLMDFLESLDIDLGQYMGQEIITSIKDDLDSGNGVLGIIAKKIQGLID
ncbi:MAG: hypothetical protein ACFFCS_27545 [Candidatus Hodarchaeota archaeon]